MTDWTVACVSACRRAYLRPKEGRSLFYGIIVVIIYTKFTNSPCMRILVRPSVTSVARRHKHNPPGRITRKYCTHPPGRGPCHYSTQITMELPMRYPSRPSEFLFWRCRSRCPRVAPSPMRLAPLDPSFGPRPEEGAPTNGSPALTPQWRSGLEYVFVPWPSGGCGLAPSGGKAEDGRNAMSICLHDGICTVLSHSIDQTAWCSILRTRSR